MAVFLAGRDPYLLCKPKSNGFNLEFLICYNDHFLLYIPFKHSYILNLAAVQYIIFIKFKTWSKISLLSYRSHLADWIEILVAILAVFCPTDEHFVMKRSDRGWHEDMQRGAYDFIGLIFKQTMEKVAYSFDNHILFITATHNKAGILLK